jgi:hypothetical protein
MNKALANTTGLPISLQIVAPLKAAPGFMLRDLE